MELKQKYGEDTCKAEILYFNNADDDALLNTFKCEIKEEPNREGTHGTFDYLDLKEFPIKSEIKEESELWQFEEKQNNQKDSRIKAEIKQDFDECDPADIESQLSTSLDLGVFKHEYTSGFSQMNLLELEVMKRIPEDSNNKKQQISVNLEETALKNSIYAKDLPNKQDLEQRTIGWIGERHECETCFKQFNQAPKLERHYLKVHTGERSHNCDICSKEFTTASNLKTHMRVHTGEKPYKCELCFKQFSDSRNLKIHLRVHDEKPHKCEICLKQFNEAGNLKQHTIMHTTETAFKCDICFKTFTTASNLKTHLRVHTGEKPYKCEICFKQYSYSIDLKRHLIRHTGEKPYKCEICFKQFGDSRNLKTHLRVHTEEAPYQCENCFKPFNETDTVEPNSID